MTLILTDLHHHALAESELMLFEDRALLGGSEVYFPFGMDWFEQGFWNFERSWHGDKVARQYLLGWWDQATYPNSDGIVFRADPRHPWRIQKGITLAAALAMKWDFVISSLPHNDEGLYQLAQQTGAHFGVQVGNNVQSSRWDLAEFILSSSTLPSEGLVDPSTWAKVTTAHGKPCVVYHQEFDTDIFRHEWPPANRREVASWVNCFPEGPSYPAFVDFARANVDDFDFKVYGAYGTGQPNELVGGDISFVPTVAATMRDARMFWHSKHWSDGYGHTVHNEFSLGRPVLGIPRYYQDKLAGPLFIDGVTSFDIESRTPDEMLRIMRRLRDDDEYHREISQNAAARFREVVDFDTEADAIAEMMGGVL